VNDGGHLNTMVVIAVDSPATGSNPLDEKPACTSAWKVALSVTCPWRRQPRELKLLAGCSKRLIAERPAKVSFREPKVALCHVPEANVFGTFDFDE
jgi:hypothetical protein